MAFKRIFIFMALLSLVSCAKKPITKPPTPIPAPTPTTPIVETLKSSLFFKNIRAIKSEVRVEASKNGDTIGAFDGLLMYKEPDYMNLRLFGPLGLTAAEFILNKRLLQIYIPFKNTIYEGEISALSEFYERKDILYAVETLRDGYVLYMLKDEKTPEGEIELIGKFVFSNTENPINTEASIYRKRTKVIGLGFSEFSGNIPLSLKLISGDVVLDLRLIEPEIDGDIPDEFFKPKDHEGREIKQLRELSKKGLNLK